ncbi:MAG: hypothetical protein KKB90_00430 [Actinobacteria bacterium]|nr:hypothetical protein [Actinomycetota bacterium]MCG2819621.1 hypothetical protein [Actinomycetes bacterium]MBU4179720.1 hypothetical protein [Actinomycetota bacterium]MBU4217413.1 hypothetical protein [Actinomycetota bacterium]MBU4359975.1 hypothetical protein [Actinomycetota bacterium]
MSETATVRIPKSTKKELEETAKELGIPQSKVVSIALRELRRKEFFKRLAEDARNLRADPVASKEYDEEFKAWDVTLSDGMEGY